MRLQVIDPQPNGRLLPYRDPINGLFWCVGGEDPYNSNQWAGPDWPDYECKQLSEIHGRDAEKINRSAGRSWLCNGPFCPGGESGCNAKGCYDEREDLIKATGGDPGAWCWVEILPKEDKQ